jgi:RNase H-fold protein (predicted Holliday junction resolvase)
MKKVLALDFGTQRIGLAISHHGLAEPLKIINNSNQVYVEVKQIIDQEGVDLILIGLSENQIL